MTIEKLSRQEEERLLSLMNQGQMQGTQSQHMAHRISHDISQVSSVSNVSTSRPQLDVPKKLDLKRMEEGTRELKDLLVDEYGNQIDAEDLLHKILSDLSTENTRKLAIQRDFLNLERAWMENEEQRRISSFDKHLASIQTASSWSRVTKSLTSFGLIAAGVAGLAAGFSGIAAAAIVAGCCLALDQLLDDKVKKTVAAWMARGDQERQEVWYNRIQLFCTAVSFAFSFGISAQLAVQLAQNVAKVAVTTGKTLADYRVSTHKALLIELDAACRIAQKSVEILMQQLQNTCDTIYQFYENTHHIEDMRQKLARLMLHFGDV